MRLPDDRIQLDQTGDAIVFKRVASTRRPAPSCNRSSAIIEARRPRPASSSRWTADHLRFTVDDQPEASGALQARLQE